MTPTAMPPAARPGRRRRPGGTDDRGSMPVAVLLTLVGVALSSVLLSMMVGQTSSTATAADRAVAVHAAQAGLDAGVARIRAAFTDGTRNEYNDRVGDRAKLPCGVLPVGSAGRGRYQVRIDYLTEDPVGEPEASLDRFVADHDLTCAELLSRTPAVALLRSTGTSRPTGAVDAGPYRKLRGTYVFRTTTQNVAGGQIRLYGHPTLCLQAGATGYPLQLATCDAAVDEQKFAYNTDLTLSVALPADDSRPRTCIDAGSAPYSGAVGTATIQTCLTAADGGAVPRQRWSFSDWGSMQGTTADNKDIADFCLRAPTATAGTAVTVDDDPDCTGDYNSFATLTPDRSVGAGAAGPASGQLVNWYEFGRCADVVRQNIEREFMQAWPCKQAPDRSKLLWNQVWSIPKPIGSATEATGPITVMHTPSGVRYCLQRPTDPKKYSKMVSCDDGTIPPDATWIRSGNTDDEATRYQISDDNPDPKKRECLSVIDPADPKPDYRTDEAFYNISKLVLRKCDGSDFQKWNAPPNITQGQPLKDVGEL